mmetsp:Transcript_997/g.2697  ORF Transcript_997/g.2697 Transcript_997/m.2697 type:complete len:234 (-) Transcript_997:358-1059(-)
MLQGILDKYFTCRLKCCQHDLLVLVLVKETKCGLDSAPIDDRLVVLVHDRAELGRLAQVGQVLVLADKLKVVEAARHALLEAAQALVNLVEHRVAARNIVLRHFVNWRDAREVVAHVVARLHGQDVLKVNERTLHLARLELGERVVKQLATLALCLFTGHVVALLNLLGASAVVATRALFLEGLLAAVAVVLQSAHVAKVALDLQVYIAVARADRIHDLTKVLGRPNISAERC